MLFSVVLNSCLSWCCVIEIFCVSVLELSGLFMCCCIVLIIWISLWLCML